MPAHHTLIKSEYLEIYNTHLQRSGDVHWFSQHCILGKKIQTYKTVGKESIMNTSVIFTWIYQMLPHLLLPSLSLPSPLTLPASWEYRVFWFILLNHLKVTCRHNFSSLRLQHDSPKNNNILLLLSGVNIFRSFLE